MNIVDEIIDAGKKVMETNPLLKAKYESWENEFLAAFEALCIESLHSEILGDKEKIGEYQLSLKDTQRYNSIAGKLNYLDSAFVQRQIGIVDGFTKDDEEILAGLRRDWNLKKGMSWAEVLLSIKITKDLYPKIVWFKDYLIALSKIDSCTDTKMQEKLDNFNIDGLAFNADIEK